MYSFACYYSLDSFIIFMNQLVCNYEHKNWKDFDFKIWSAVLKLFSQVFFCICGLLIRTADVRMRTCMNQALTVQLPIFTISILGLFRFYTAYWNNVFILVIIIQIKKFTKRIFINSELVMQEEPYNFPD